MVSENRDILTLNPWAVFAPAALIALLTIAVNLVGDSVSRSMGRSMSVGSTELKQARVALVTGGARGIGLAIADAFRAAGAAVVVLDRERGRRRGRRDARRGRRARGRAWRSSGTAASTGP